MRACILKAEGEVGERSGDTDSDGNPHPNPSQIPKPKPKLGPSQTGQIDVAH